MSDICEELADHVGSHDEGLRVEIKRLRALITAWADADAVVQHQKNLNRYSNRTVPTVLSRRLFDAAEALRSEARQVKS